VRNYGSIWHYIQDTATFWTKITLLVSNTLLESDSVRYSHSHSVLEKLEYDAANGRLSNFDELFRLIDTAPACDVRM